MIYVVRLCWGVPALLLLALLWVLSSPAGSQFILNQASKYSGGLLQAGTVTSGHLLGRLEIDQLSVRTPAAEVDLDQVVLDWSPLSLLPSPRTTRSLPEISMPIRSGGEPACQRTLPVWMSTGCICGRSPSSEWPSTLFSASIARIRLVKPSPESEMPMPP